MILICYGTRPEYLKIKPLMEKLKGVVPFKSVYVQQHNSLLDGIESDEVLHINCNNENRLNCLIAEISKNLTVEPYSHVLVQGDTATAFAVALAAFNNKKKVIHLEAGLRTKNIDNPFPEEAYRQMISRITSLHLCPTELAKTNLLVECCAGEVEVVGNTVLDNIENPDDITHEDCVLVTLHRRENHEVIEDYFTIIDSLAEKYSDIEFILPIHPNPEVIKHASLFKNITPVDPMNHKDLISVLRKVKLIITDSGGIQEEASFLRKKAIVCRKSTERKESVGQTSFICSSPSELSVLFDELINDFKVSPDYVCPYGSGDSSEKCVDILAEWINK
jgi:UDP-N-acetylglucosamine 2-epimerase (non-hydrolysing)